MSSIFAISWAILLLTLAPIAGLLSRRPLAVNAKPRPLLYAGSAINLILIAAITAGIDSWNRGKAIRAVTAILSLSHFLGWAIAISLVCLAISIGVYLLRAKLNRPPSVIVVSLLPQTLFEKTLFVALCVLIGVVEEFIFRGFAFFTLGGLLQNNALAITIVTICFALQHGIQDVIGIVRAFILGALLAVPVLVTGSLLPSIIAHALVDTFSGLYGRSLLERFGIVIPK